MLESAPWSESPPRPLLRNLQARGAAGEETGFKGILCFKVSYQKGGGEYIPGPRRVNLLCRKCRNAQTTLPQNASTPHACPSSARIRSHVQANAPGTLPSAVSNSESTTTSARSRTFRLIPVCVLNVSPRLGPSQPSLRRNPQNCLRKHPRHRSLHFLKHRPQQCHPRLTPTIRQHPYLDGRGRPEKSLRPRLPRISNLEGRRLLRRPVHHHVQRIQKLPCLRRRSPSSKAPPAIPAAKPSPTHTAPPLPPHVPPLRQVPRHVTHGDEFRPILHHHRNSDARKTPGSPPRPDIGDGVTPLSRNPASAAQLHHPPQHFRVNQGIAHHSALALPPPARASNCGFTSATTLPRRSRCGSTFGSTCLNEMKRNIHRRNAPTLSANSKG